MSIPPSDRDPSACPRCAAPLRADQDWCLHCGAAARTRLAPTPNWRTPLIVTAVAVLIAIAGLGLAFVSLTGDDPPAAATTTTPAAPAAAAPATTVPPAATTPAP